MPRRKSQTVAPLNPALVASDGKPLWSAMVLIEQIPGDNANDVMAKVLAGINVNAGSVQILGTFQMAGRLERASKRNPTSKRITKPVIAPTTSVVGQRLAQLRAERGESLQQAADLIGVAKQHLWLIEHGKSVNPRMTTLQRIADKYGVSVSYLVGETAEPHSQVA